MKDCRARALILFEIGKKANLPENKSQAVALAQMWLTLVAIQEALAIWADQVKKTMQ